MLARVSTAKSSPKVFFGKRYSGYDHYIRILPGAISVLSAAAKNLGCPRDHLLVVIVAAAFARMSKQDVVKLTLIVPMRDGPGETHIVSNLSTTADMNLRTAGRSLIGLAFEASRRLRLREWDVPPIPSEGDRVFVNLRIAASFPGASPVPDSVDTRRNATHTVRNLLEMFIDDEQHEGGGYLFSLGVKAGLDGSEFAKKIESVIRDLALAPLAPVVGEDTL